MRRGHSHQSPCSLAMDIETPNSSLLDDSNLLLSLRAQRNTKSFDREQGRLSSRYFRSDGPSSPTIRGHQHDESVRRAETSHGMPWRTSIDPSYQRENLFYMPFWEWQMSFMKENLSNLRGLDTVATGKDTTNGQKDMTYVENADGTMRMHTAMFASDEYKTIRLTVLDAGSRTQVFTSLWYPQPCYNLPVLGIDFLQMKNSNNQKSKHLCVVDFQPIQSNEGDHDQRYEHLLAPVRRQYPSLQGKLTKHFYDENQFFSNQMLLGRHDDDDDDSSTADAMVFRDLSPAYQAYVRTHVNLVQSTAPNMERIPAILERHAAYDSYSAARDPGRGVLARMFGKEWADDYIHDIMFPLSHRK
jgi:15,16-dihydrobiliverdin:ferredoxin oxidoreductase